MGIEDIYPAGWCTDNSVRHNLEQNCGTETIGETSLRIQSQESTMQRRSISIQRSLSFYASSTIDSVQGTGEKHVRTYF